MPEGEGGHVSRHDEEEKDMHQGGRPKDQSLPDISSFPSAPAQFHQAGQGAGKGVQGQQGEGSDEQTYRDEDQQVILAHLIQPGPDGSGVQIVVGLGVEVGQQGVDDHEHG